MKRFLVIVTVAALLMAVGAAPGVARPGEIEASATAVFVEEVDPGESWFADDVMHVRNVVWRSRVEGIGDNAEYLTGEMSSVFSFNWNYKTGALNSWMTFEVTLDAFDGGYGGSAVVAGPPNPDAIGGACAEFPMWKVVGKGFGDLEGAQYRWDLTSDTCGFLVYVDATIFFPGR